MSQTLTIYTDDLLDGALREQARAQGKTVSEMAREILSRTLLGPKPHVHEERSEAPESRLPPLNRRDREHAWRRSHRKLLQSRYANQWVVLEGEDIMAHDRDALQAVEKAKAKGITVPYVFYVQPPREPGVVRIGL